MVVFKTLPKAHLRMLSFLSYVILNYKNISFNTFYFKMCFFFLRITSHICLSPISITLFKEVKCILNKLS